MYRIILIIAFILLIGSCASMKKPLPVNEAVKVQYLHSKVNSKYHDYSPCFLSDGSSFLFVTNRPGTLFNYKANCNSHDIWLAAIENIGDSAHKVNSIQNNSTSDPPGLGFNTNYNEGAMCFSSDFKKMYFTGCNRADGYGRCDIYEADVKIMKKEIYISNIKNLGLSINSEKWESMPSISPDSKTLYFISDRDSPSKLSSIEFDEFPSIKYTYERTNMDIFYSNFVEKDNKWMPAKKLTKIINSDENEYSPLICPDGKTLIFASTGFEPNGGGYDLYYSKIDSTGNWSEPVNFGTPMNSEFDDYYLTISTDGEKGFFSSNRKYPNLYLDLYQFNMTSIIYDVRTISWRQKTIENVEIIIFDENGSQVHYINRGNKQVGIHSFEWDGKDENGNDCKPGKYYYQIFAGDEPPDLPRILTVKKNN